MILSAMLVVTGCVGIASQLGEPMPNGDRCMACVALVAAGIAIWIFSLGKMA